MTKIALILGYFPKVLPGLNSPKELNTKTPFGKSSSPVLYGKTDNKEIFIILRHGNNNNIPSHNINNKANIFALHELGCRQIIATSCCGSLQDEICPGEFVIFDQFMNFSHRKEQTFSDKLTPDKLNQSSFFKPFSDNLRDSLIEACVINGYTTHTKGIVMAIDSLRQSTRAESNLYRQWGADIVNTTIVPEVIFANELQIQYACISLCTHYEPWRTDIPPASEFEKHEIIESRSENILKVLITGISKLTID
jgi:5'-methylthioadenosine phosphorylase